MIITKHIDFSHFLFVLIGKSGKIYYANQCAKAKLGLKENKVALEVFNENFLEKVFTSDIFEADFRYKDLSFLYSSVLQEEKVLLILQDLTLMFAVESDREKQRALQFQAIRNQIRRLAFKEYAHNINNKLQIILAKLAKLQKGALSSGDFVNELKKHIESISSFIHRSNNSNILEEEAESTFSLSELVNECVLIMKDNLYLHGFEVEVDPKLDLEITFKKSELRFCFLEMIENAMKFNQGKQNNKIKVTLMENKKDEITVTFEDNGDGIKIFDPQQVFEPFYTSDINNRSAGTGLFQVRSILRGKQGDIDYFKGTGFGLIIRLNKKDKA